MSHLYWNVEYDYAVNSQLPRPDLHRQDTQPYRLRPEMTLTRQRYVVSLRLALRRRLS
jgi:hypothetical protein